MKSLIDVKDPLVMAEAGALQQQQQQQQQQQARVPPLSHAAASIMSPKLNNAQVQLNSKRAHLSMFIAAVYASKTHYKCLSSTL